MATIRLVPSTYYLSNSSYLSVTDATNMYNNTDNTTYATVYNSRSSTSSYYIYLRGFNFSDVPDGAVINSFSIKLKAYESGISTSTSYRPYICNSTTTLTGTCSVLSTSAQTLTFSGVTATWDTISGYGSNFGIRICCRRASSSTAAYAYIYGAEIEVDYTELEKRTITTSTDSSDITITPSGTTTVYDGNSFTLTMNADSQPNVTDNGVDVSDSIEIKPSTGTVTATPSEYSTSGSVTGTYYTSAIGQGSDGTTTTGNCYCSTSGSTATIIYSFNLSAVPAGVDIESVSCSVKGHCESTSASSETASCQLYCGDTAKGSATSFTSTSDAVIDLTTGSWTRTELDSLTLHFTIGYYGGNVSGATVSVEYALDGIIYVYTISSVGEDHTIVVSDGTPAVYYTVTSTIKNGTITSTNPVSVRENASTTITFSGDDGYEFSGMKVNGVSVTPTKASGGTSSATWTPTTNYATYSTYAFSNINDGDTSSYWWSNGAQTAGNYILITFSEKVVLNSFQTYSSHSTDYPQSCNVLQISSDNSTWETIGTFQDAQTSTFSNIGKECLYARIYAESTISNWMVINEITIDYSAPATNDYTYTISNVTEETSVVIVFGSDLGISVKLNGTWTEVITVYKKVNGAWVEQSAFTSEDLAGKALIYKGSV